MLPPALLNYAAYGESSGEYAHHKDREHKERWAMQGTSRPAGAPAMRSTTLRERSAGVPANPSRLLRPLNWCSAYPTHPVHGTARWVGGVPPIFRHRRVLLSSVSSVSENRSRKLDASGLRRANMHCPARGAAYGRSDNARNTAYASRPSRPGARPPPHVEPARIRRLR